MTELRDYDPLKVVGSWTTPVGVFDILEGRINGEFVSITRDNPNWTREQDMAGNATRVKNPSKGGSFTITLDASSPTNATFSKLMQTDDLEEGIVGVIILKDLNGDTVLEADGAFIEGPPATSFGNTRGERTWTFQCAAIRHYLGGRDLA